MYKRQSNGTDNKEAVEEESASNTSTDNESSDFEGKKENESTDAEIKDTIEGQQVPTSSKQEDKKISDDEHSLARNTEYSLNQATKSESATVMAEETESVSNLEDDESEEIKSTTESDNESSHHVIKIGLNEEDGISNNETQVKGNTNKTSDETNIDKEEEIGENQNKDSDNEVESKLSNESYVDVDETRSEESESASPVEEESTYIKVVDASLQTHYDDMSDAYIQTDPVLEVSLHVQTKTKPTSSIGCQTDPIENCSFNVQSFEHDENYLAEVCKPKPLGKYFSGASVKSVPHTSQDPVMISMESTYQLTTAELSVLFDNIKNMDEFFKDQCTQHLEERTKRSISNMYIWRVPEIEKLNDIVRLESASYMKTITSIQEFEGPISTYMNDILKKIDNDMIQIKEQLLQIEYLNSPDSNGQLGSLKVHQSEIRSKLRGKMHSILKEINHISESLNILKIYAIRDKKLDENPLVSKLTFDSPSSMKVLREIKDLRTDLQDLRKSRTDQKEDDANMSLVKRDIESAEIVEAGLLLDTRKEVGEFFKRLNAERF